mgnify:CR=1 FL=1
MDFTFKKYKDLLKALIANEYFFQTFNDFITSPKDKTVILRHDVDRLPYNSLQIAIIEKDLGIRSSYYFRATKGSWDDGIVSQINDMGHEVGYHYENLTVCNGHLEKGIRDFEINLNKMRKVADINTICMHGSPTSKWDSKDLWEKYSYKDYGIIGEPYFDIDFDEVCYFTDTGRKWNGQDTSVRDKVNSKYNFNFKTTQHIIDNIDSLPSQLMFTAHPQRWDDRMLPWIKELILQNIKNKIKKGIKWLR